MKAGREGFRVFGLGFGWELRFWASFGRGRLRVAACRFLRREVSEASDDLTLQSKGGLA